MEQLPSIEANQSCCCENGCGECRPVQIDYEYSRTEDMDGNLIGSKTEKVWVATAARLDLISGTRTNRHSLRCPSKALNLYPRSRDRDTDMKPLAEHKEWAKAPLLRGEVFRAVLEVDNSLILFNDVKLRFVSNNDVLMCKCCISYVQMQQLINAEVKITEAIELLHQAFLLSFDKPLPLFDRRDIKPKISKPFFRKNERW